MNEGTHEGPLDIDDLHGLTGGKAGVVDTLCPECGPHCRSPANRTRKVLRVWDDGEFVTYKCARCEISGWAVDGSAKTTGHRRERIKLEPAPDKADTARFLWDRAVAAPGTLVERYLRARGCWVASQAIRYLAPSGAHQPAMITRFGLDGPVTGVHLTKLRTDGAGKAGTETDKIMLGPSSGQPLAVFDNPERGELLIAEGIEDAASLATVTGWTSWAAGSWARLAAMIEATRGFDRVFIAKDHDRDGLKGFERAKSTRPDIIGIDCAKLFGVKAKMDPNAVLLRHGRDVLLAAIEWSALQDDRARNRIGNGALAREIARIGDVFRRPGLIPKVLHSGLDNAILSVLRCKV